ncbi:MAG: 3-deoxy-D-manno-octulosonic acid transferase [Oligoflexus sp.]
MALLPWYVYSVLFWFLAQLAQVISWFRPALVPQLEGRWWTESDWQELQSWTRRYQRRLVIFCSSAGEYEQAKPLIARLSALPSCGVMTIIFSQSGMRFAKAQGDTLELRRASWDFLWVWQRFFRLLQPEVTAIVRHEIWPAFLHAAYRQGSKIFLIDAVAFDSPPRFNRLWKSYLYQFFHKICAVSVDDRQRFIDDYACLAEQVEVTGDTKYDRVFERLEERTASRLQLENQLDQLWPRQRRLIIGSAWPADVRPVLAVYERRNELLQGWQVIIAPHELHSSMIEWLVAECLKHSLSYELWSELKQSGTRQPSHAKVLIVDALGILAELYGCADLAFVGGGMHHRVHNVLEPSCHSLPVCFGPLHHTSQEAKYLLARNLVTVITTENDLQQWWFHWHQQNDLVDHQLLAEVKALCGASDRILRMFAIVLEEWNGG